MLDDINSDATPDSGIVLVDNGAPLASYNLNPLWVLMCSLQPQMIGEGGKDDYGNYLSAVKYTSDGVYSSIQQVIPGSTS